MLFWESISLEINHHISVAGEGKVQPDGCQMAKGTAGAAVTGTGRQFDTCAVTNGTWLERFWDRAAARETSFS